MWYLTRIVLPFGLLISAQDLYVAYATGGGSIPASIIPWPFLILIAGWLAGWRSGRALTGAMVGAGLGMLGVLATSLQIPLFPTAYPYLQSLEEWGRLVFSLATGWVPIGAILGGGAARFAAQFRLRQAQQSHAQ